MRLAQSRQRDSTQENSPLADFAQTKAKQSGMIMKYYHEELYLKDENNTYQKDNNYRAWIFGRDREERAQIINALKKEQWPVISIQSLDYFESLINQLSPDILILCSDIMSTFGNQLIRELRKSGKIVPILCIGKILQAENCITALEEGANDYLHSPLNKRELVSRARKAASLMQPKPMAQRLETIKNDKIEEYTICNLEFNPGTQKLINQQGNQTRLTKGEVDILLLLCELKGKTISRQRLADLTQTDAMKSRTIDVRISRLKKKITLLDPTESYITSKRHEGYYFTDNIKAKQGTID